MVPEDRGDAAEPSKLAYCPLLERRCGDVDCGRCALIEEEFGADILWVCTTCTTDLEILPFWGDGECGICGFESCVLMLSRDPQGG